MCNVNGCTGRKNLAEKTAASPSICQNFSPSDIQSGEDLTEENSSPNHDESHILGQLKL